MSREWSVQPLASFVDPDRSICYGIVQPGAPVNDGVPILRVNNFSGTGLDASNAMQVSKAIEDNYRRSRLRGGELLVTLVGSLGLTAIAPDEMAGWNVARAVGVVPLASDADIRWINFVVRSQPAQDFMAMRANTTVQATFNLKDLAELPIPMPPPQTRRAMSEMLSSLDDKIELNMRMNETLEASARALFRDWFVDFGPTRAKGKGCPAYLPPDLWSLFPDRFDNDGLPKGWSWSRLGEHVTNFDSKRVPVSGAERAKRQGPYPYYGATSVMDYVDDFLFEGVYLLVGEDGSVVKDNGLAFTQYVSGKMWVNNHAHVLQGRGAVTTEHILLFFDHAQVHPFITGDPMRR